jgi:hypothetical protein
MVVGSAAIHHHNLGLHMLCGISSTGPFGPAKQCAINAFDTDYLLSVDEVMASILLHAHNMNEEVSAPGVSAPDASPLPSLRLSLLAAVHTAVEDTPNVALVVVAAFPASAAPMAAWTTYCPLALPQLTPYSGGPLPNER